MSLITHDELLSRVGYDAETGIFTWIKPASRRAKAGSVAGSVMPAGYRIISIDKKFYYAHRLAWFYAKREWPQYDIDHINMRKDDNRIANLRPATRSQNLCNRKLRSDSKSGFKGITKDKSKWVARISVFGRHRLVGAFDSPEAAHQAYREAAAWSYGTFARFQ